MCYSSENVKTSYRTGNVCYVVIMLYAIQLKNMEISYINHKIKGRI